MKKVNAKVFSMKITTTMNNAHKQLRHSTPSKKRVLLMNKTNTIIHNTAKKQSGTDNGWSKRSEPR